MTEFERTTAQMAGVYMGVDLVKRAIAGLAKDGKPILALDYEIALGMTQKWAIEQLAAAGIAEHEKQLEAAAAEIAQTTGTL